MLKHSKTKHWKSIRAKAMLRAKGICERCGRKKRLYAHHKTYEREGEELLEDILMVCSQCHSIIHLYDDSTEQKKKQKTGSLYLRLKEELETRGVSQSEFARRNGWKKQFINRLCRERIVSLNMATLDSLCDALNCQPGDLLIRIKENNGRTPFTSAMAQKESQNRNKQFPN